MSRQASEPLARGMSVQLLGVGHGDHDCDGISDLIAKCNRSVVQELVDCGDQVKITVRVNLRMAHLLKALIQFRK